MSDKKHPFVQIVKFVFDGDELAVASEEGKASLVIRRACEALGLSFPAQLKALRGSAATTVAMIATVAEDGRRRRLACLDIRLVPLWLARIHPSKVAPHLRAKLIRYQREAAEVLADHFIGRRGVTAQSTMPPEVIEALTALPLLAKAVVELRKDLESLRSQVAINGGVISGNQLDELRRAADYNVRSLVALGDYENLRAARMAVNNLVVSVSSWGGIGKRRHLMPSSHFSTVMAALGAQRKDLDRRLRAVRKDAPRKDEQRSFSWGPKEPAQA